MPRRSRSARHHTRGAGPRWLERSWIEEDALRQTGASRFSRDTYRQAFGAPLPPSEGALVEARIQHPSMASDPLEDLVGAAPAHVGRWMRRKAALADGTSPGFSCVTADSARVACDRSAAERPDWRLPRGTSSVEAWPVLRVALLRDLAGLSWAQIGALTSISESAARRRYASHRVWVETDVANQKTHARVSHRCLQG